MFSFPLSFHLDPLSLREVCFFVSISAAAQLLCVIGRLQESKEDTQKVAVAARTYLTRARTCTLNAHVRSDEQTLQVLQKQDSAGSKTLYLPHEKLGELFVFEDSGLHFST